MKLVLLKILARQGGEYVPKKDDRYGEYFTTLDVKVLGEVTLDRPVPGKK